MRDRSGDLHRLTGFFSVGRPYQLQPVRENREAGAVLLQEAAALCGSGPESWDQQPVFERGSGQPTEGGIKPRKQAQVSEPGSPAAVRMGEAACSGKNSPVRRAPSIR